MNAIVVVATFAIVNLPNTQIVVGSSILLLFLPFLLLPLLLLLLVLALLSLSIHLIQEAVGPMILLLLILLLLLLLLLLLPLL